MADEADDFLYDYENYRQIKLLLEFIQDDGYDISDFYMYERDMNRYCFASRTIGENGLLKRFYVVLEVIEVDNSFTIKPVAKYIDNSQVTVQNPCNYFVAKNIEEAVQKSNQSEKKVVSKSIARLIVLSNQ